MASSERTFPSFIHLLLAGSFIILIHSISIFWIPIPKEVLIGLRWIFIGWLIFDSYKANSLTRWILVSMVIGTVFGYDFPGISQELKVVSKIFLRLIKTIIAPLIFATLVVGIAGHSNIKQVGRMGWKSLLYFEVVTTLALFIGLFAINISGAGKGITLPAHVDTETLQVQKKTLSEIILHIFPENIAKSIAEGEVLQIVIFSILFGIGLALVDEKRKTPMLTFMESLSETMFKFTGIIMYFAPFAVGAAIAYTVGHMGLGVLLNLFKLLATLYVALLIFLVGILLPIAIAFKIPVKKFVLAIADPVALAFATTSSESALPKAMKAMESIGVPRKIVSFVMPVCGASSGDSIDLGTTIINGIHINGYQ
jgi:proton glutamate symport protein